MRRLHRAATSILAVALATPLLVYAATGAFSRYTADDYCWAGVLRDQGFLRAQAWWYVGYSPRYAFTFIVNLVELAGPTIVPVLPTLAILLWVATLVWTLRQFGLNGAELLLAPLIALATFATAPDLPQSLYWQTGMLTYLLPLVLATFLIGWIQRSLTHGYAMGAAVVCGLITFVAGGLSEAYLIPQNVALTLALGVALLARQWRAATLLGAALTGGVLALALVVLAPATPGRVGDSPADLWLASAAAIATAATQAARLVRSFAAVLALCLAVPVLLGCADKRRDLRQLAVVTVLTAIVAPFCYFPSFYASNGNPPARSLIVPASMFVGWAVYAGYTLRGWLALPRAWRTGLAVLLALVPLGLAVVAVPGVATARAYAAQWDAEDAQIRGLRDAGQRSVKVPPLPRNLGEDFVTTDPDHFFNRCVARYYGLDAIAATSEP